MAKIRIHNQMTWPQDVPCNPGSLMLPVNSHIDVEQSRVCPVWLSAVSGSTAIRIEALPDAPPPPPPLAQAPAESERAMLVREARAMGIKVRKDWTDEQIIEAMTR